MCTEMIPLLEGLSDQLTTLPIDDLTTHPPVLDAFLAYDALVRAARQHSPDAGSAHRVPNNPRLRELIQADLNHPCPTVAADAELQDILRDLLTRAPQLRVGS